MSIARQFGTKVLRDALILTVKFGRIGRPGTSPLMRRRTMPKDDITCLINFAPKESNRDDLRNGHLYMNAAGFSHGPYGERSDPLQVSVAYGMDTYDMPIYSMHAIRGSDIVNDIVLAPGVSIIDSVRR